MHEVQGFEILDRAPSVLLSEGLHPQREDAQAADAIVNPAVVAVEPVLTEAAQNEPVAIRAEGIGPHPATVGRCALALALEVREYETGDERDRTERRKVILGQSILLAKLDERLDLLLGVLRRSHDARDEEDQAVGGRLIVLQFPVLQIRPLFVTRPGFRSVLLQGEAGLDRPDYRTIVAEIRSQLAPLRNRVDELGRHILVRKSGKEGAVHNIADEVLGELLELVALVHQSQLFLFRKVEDERGQGVERSLPVHGLSPSPKWGHSQPKWPRGIAGVSIPSLLLNRINEPKEDQELALFCLKKNHFTNKVV